MQVHHVEKNPSCGSVQMSRLSADLDDPLEKQVVLAQGGGGIPRRRCPGRFRTPLSALPVFEGPLGRKVGVGDRGPRIGWLLFRVPSVNQEYLCVRVSLDADAHFILSAESRDLSLGQCKRKANTLTTEKLHFGKRQTVYPY